MLNNNSRAENIDVLRISERMRDKSFFFPVFNESTVPDQSPSHDSNRLYFETSDKRNSHEFLETSTLDSFEDLSVRFSPDSSERNFVSRERQSRRLHTKNEYKALDKKIDPPQPAEQVAQQNGTDEPVVRLLRAVQFRVRQRVVHRLEAMVRNSAPQHGPADSQPLCPSARILKPIVSAEDAGMAPAPGPQTNRVHSIVDQRQSQQPCSAIDVHQDRFCGAAATDDGLFPPPPPPPRRLAADRCLEPAANGERESLTGAVSNQSHGWDIHRASSEEGLHNHILFGQAAAAPLEANSGTEDLSRQLEEMMAGVQERVRRRVEARLHELAAACARLDDVAAADIALNTPPPEASAAATAESKVSKDSGPQLMQVRISQNATPSLSESTEIRPATAQKLKPMKGHISFPIVRDAEAVPIEPIQPKEVSIQQELRVVTLGAWPPPPPRSPPVAPTLASPYSRKDHSSPISEWLMRPTGDRDGNDAAAPVVQATAAPTYATRDVARRPRIVHRRVNPASEQPGRPVAAPLSPSGAPSGAGQLRRQLRAEQRLRVAAALDSILSDKEAARLAAPGWPGAVRPPTVENAPCATVKGAVAATIAAPSIGGDARGRSSAPPAEPATKRSSVAVAARRLPVVVVPVGKWKEGSSDVLVLGCDGEPARARGMSKSAGTATENAQPPSSAAAPSSYSSQQLQQGDSDSDEQKEGPAVARRLEARRRELDRSLLLEEGPAAKEITDRLWQREDDAICGLSPWLGQESSLIAPAPLMAAPAAQWEAGAWSSSIIPEFDASQEQKLGTESVTTMALGVAGSDIDFETSKLGFDRPLQVSQEHFFESSVSTPNTSKKVQQVPVVHAPAAQLPCSHQGGAHSVLIQMSKNKSVLDTQPVVQIWDGLLDALDSDEMAGTQAICSVAAVTKQALPPMHELAAAAFERVTAAQTWKTEILIGTLTRSSKSNKQPDRSLRSLPSEDGTGSDSSDSDDNLRRRPFATSLKSAPSDTHRTSRTGVTGMKVGGELAGTTAQFSSLLSDTSDSIQVLVPERRAFQTQPEYLEEPAAAAVAEDEHGLQRSIDLYCNREHALAAGRLFEGRDSDSDSDYDLDSQRLRLSAAHSSQNPPRVEREYKVPSIEYAEVVGGNSVLQRSQVSSSCHNQDGRVQVANVGLMQQGCQDVSTGDHCENIWTKDSESSLDGQPSSVHGLALSLVLCPKDRAGSKGTLFSSRAQTGDDIARSGDSSSESDGGRAVSSIELESGRQISSGQNFLSSSSDSDSYDDYGHAFNLKSRPLQQGHIISGTVTGETGAGYAAGMVEPQSAPETDPLQSQHADLVMLIKGTSGKADEHKDKEQQQDGEVYWTQEMVEQAQIVSSLKEESSVSTAAVDSFQSLFNTVAGATGSTLLSISPMRDQVSIIPDSILPQTGIECLFESNFETGYAEGKEPGAFQIRSDIVKDRFVLSADFVLDNETAAASSAAQAETEIESSSVQDSLSQTMTASGQQQKHHSCQEIPAHDWVETRETETVQVILAAPTSNTNTVNNDGCGADWEGACNFSSDNLPASQVCAGIVSAPDGISSSVVSIHRSDAAKAATSAHIQHQEILLEPNQSGELDTCCNSYCSAITLATEAVCMSYPAEEIDVTGKTSTQQPFEMHLDNSPRDCSSERELQSRRQGDSDNTLLYVISKDLDQNQDTLSGQELQSTLRATECSAAAASAASAGKATMTQWPGMAAIDLDNCPLASIDMSLPTQQALERSIQSNVTSIIVSGINDTEILSSSSIDPDHYQYQVDVSGEHSWDHDGRDQCCDSCLAETEAIDEVAALYGGPKKRVRFALGPAAAAEAAAVYAAATAAACSIVYSIDTVQNDDSRISKLEYEARKFTDKRDVSDSAVQLGHKLPLPTLDEWDEEEEKAEKDESTGCSFEQSEQLADRVYRDGPIDTSKALLWQGMDEGNGVCAPTNVEGCSVAEETMGSSDAGCCSCGDLEDYHAVPSARTLANNADLDRSQRMETAFDDGERQHLLPSAGTASGVLGFSKASPVHSVQEKRDATSLTEIALPVEPDLSLPVSARSESGVKSNAATEAEQVETAIATVMDALVVAAVVLALEDSEAKTTDCSSEAPTTQCAIETGINVGTSNRLNDVEESHNQAATESGQADQDRLTQLNIPLDIPLEFPTQQIMNEQSLHDSPQGGLEPLQERRLHWQRMPPSPPPRSPPASAFDLLNHTQLSNLKQLTTTCMHQSLSSSGLLAGEEYPDTTGWSSAAVVLVEQAATAAAAAAAAAATAAAAAGSPERPVTSSDGESRETECSEGQLSDSKAFDHPLIRSSLSVVHATAPVGMLESKPTISEISYEAESLSSDVQKEVRAVLAVQPVHAASDDLGHVTVRGSVEQSLQQPRGCAACDSRNQDHDASSGSGTIAGGGHEEWIRRWARSSLTPQVSPDSGMGLTSLIGLIGHNSNFYSEPLDTVRNGTAETLSASNGEWIRRWAKRSEQPQLPQLQPLSPPQPPPQPLQQLQYPNAADWACIAPKIISPEPEGGVMQCESGSSIVAIKQPTKMAGDDLKMPFPPASVSPVSATSPEPQAADPGAGYETTVSTPSIEEAFVLKPSPVSAESSANSVPLKSDGRDSESSTDMDSSMSVLQLRHQRRQQLQLVDETESCGLEAVLDRDLSEPNTRPQMTTIDSQDAVLGFLEAELRRLDREFADAVTPPPPLVCKAAPVPRRRLVERGLLPEGYAVEPGAGADWRELMPRMGSDNSRRGAARDSVTRTVLSVTMPRPVPLLESSLQSASQSITGNPEMGLSTVVGNQTEQSALATYWGESPSSVFNAKAVTGTAQILVIDRDRILTPPREVAEATSNIEALVNLADRNEPTQPESNISLLSSQSPPEQLQSMVKVEADLDHGRDIVGDGLQSSSQEDFIVYSKTADAIPQHQIVALLPLAGAAGSSGMPTCVPVTPQPLQVNLDCSPEDHSPAGIVIAAAVDGLDGLATHAAQWVHSVFPWLRPSTPPVLTESMSDLSTAAVRAPAENTGRPAEDEPSPAAALLVYGETVGAHTVVASPRTPRQAGSAKATAVDHDSCGDDESVVTDDTEALITMKQTIPKEQPTEMVIRKGHAVGLPGVAGDKEISVDPSSRLQQPGADESSSRYSPEKLKVDANLCMQSSSGEFNHNSSECKYLHCVELNAIPASLAWMPLSSAYNRTVAGKFDSPPSQPPLNGSPHSGMDADDGVFSEWRRQQADAMVAALRSLPTEDCDLSPLSQTTSAITVHGYPGAMDGGIELDQERVNPANKHELCNGMLVDVTESEACMLGSEPGSLQNSLTMKVTIGTIQIDSFSTLHETQAGGDLQQAEDADSHWKLLIEGEQAESPGNNGVAVLAIGNLDRQQKPTAGFLSIQSTDSVPVDNCSPSSSATQPTSEVIANVDGALELAPHASIRLREDSDSLSESQQHPYSRLLPASQRNLGLATSWPSAAARLRPGELGRTGEFQSTRNSRSQSLPMTAQRPSRGFESPSFVAAVVASRETGCDFNMVEARPRKSDAAVGVEPCDQQTEKGKTNLELLELRFQGALRDASETLRAVAAGGPWQQEPTVTGMADMLAIGVPVVQRGRRSAQV